MLASYVYSGLWWNQRSLHLRNGQIKPMGYLWIIIYYYDTCTWDVFASPVINTCRNWWPD